MTPRLCTLVLLALLSVCFSISSRLVPFYAGREPHSGEGGVLMFLLGDSRRLLANEFFAKADAYYHGGYYPGIFDKPMAEHGEHMLVGVGHKAAHQGEDHDDDDDFLGPPMDLIDRFGRHFFPSKHRHLEKPGEAREILPWLRLSADMDPHLVDTYVVSAFWLREQLGKVDEAETFLREGLRANPGNPAILLELGRVKAENRHDDATARHLWELCLTNLTRSDASTNRFLIAQVLGQLERLEERQLRWSKAVQYLEMLKEVAPIKGPIQKQIEEIKVQVDGKPGQGVPEPQLPTRGAISSPTPDKPPR